MQLSKTTVVVAALVSAACAEQACSSHQGHEGGIAATAAVSCKIESGTAHSTTCKPGCQPRPPRKGLSTLQCHGNDLYTGPGPNLQPDPQLNPQPTDPVKMVKAVCLLRGNANITGTVVFEQESESAPTKITYNITGHDPNSERGFHVHTFGDTTNGCISTGPHYNPFNMSHGSPNDAVRHVGDMGNIKTDAQGASWGTLNDTQIRLMGPYSVIGRAVVVHSGVDDLGKGGHEQSPHTGNAGGRPACGVIGIAK